MNRRLILATLTAFCSTGQVSAAGPQGRYVVVEARRDSAVGNA